MEINLTEEQMRNGFAKFNRNLVEEMKCKRVLKHIAAPLRTQVAAMMLDRKVTGSDKAAQYGNLRKALLVMVGATGDCKDYTFSSDEMVVLRDALVEEYQRLKELASQHQDGLHPNMARKLRMLFVLKEQFKEDCAKMK